MRVGTVTRAGVVLALLVSVSACTPKPPSIMQIERGQVTPDEFAILPSKPIEIPQDMSALPPPNPLGANRTDATPRADAVAALGGNPARMQLDGKLGADGALIRQGTRYGITPEIRTELATDDLEFRSRKRGRLLERLFQVPTYYRAYEKDSLNQHGTLELYRLNGLPTPAAPPDPEAN